MAANSKIEWTTHTFNPWRGCTKVSPGCANCYADALSKRNPKQLGVWGPRGDRVIAGEKYWQDPLKWNQQAKGAAERPRVFCASLADVFEGRDTQPESAWFPVELARARLFDLIRMTPHLDWLLLTKRPENAADRTFGTNGIWYSEGWPSNVWLGTSVERQEEADERIPHLLKCPTAVHFLSCEPLLGEVNLKVRVPALRCERCRFDFTSDEATLTSIGEPECPKCGDSYPVDVIKYPKKSGIDLVIAGGESGPGARPMPLAAPRSLRDQCQAAGVAFHFKQWGDWVPYEPDAQAPFWKSQHGDLFDSHGFPDGLIDCDRIGQWWSPDLLAGTVYRHVGKKVAGRQLDGRAWDEMPDLAGRITR